MGLKRVKSWGVSAVAFMVAASSLLFVAQQRSYGADTPAPAPQPTAPAPVPAASGDVINQGDGVTAYFSMPSASENAKSEALAAIIKWRQDALKDTSVKWPDPDAVHAKTIAEYLKAHSISESDYLNPKWSHDLNVIANIRATETVLLKKMVSQRLNGGEPLGISVNGHKSSDEALLWGQPNITAAVNTWAAQKAAYVANPQSTAVAQYEWIINPTYTRYAVEHIPSGYNGQTYVGEASTQPLQNEAPAELPVWSPVKLAADAIDYTKLQKQVKDTVEGASYELTSPKIATTAYGREALIKGTWSSATPSVVTVEKAEGVNDYTLTGKTAGDGAVTFTPDITPATAAAAKAQTYSLSVTLAYITSADDPAGITVPSGTRPTLPKTVTAYWNNGKTTQEHVTWNQPANRNYWKEVKGGKTTIEGYVDTLTDPVHIVVTVEPATITAVSVDPSSITTESGTAPALSDVVATVSWSNNEVSVETISWDPISKRLYSGRDGGTFTANGTVVDGSKNVQVSVVVNPARITSVANPAKVVTTKEQAPVLPKTVVATWSNGDKTNEAVTWNNIDAAQYANVGMFTVNGMAAKKAVRVQVEVVDAVITSVDDPAAVTTPSGTAPTLPATVTVHLSNGKQATQAVEWKNAANPDYYKAREGGKTVLEGTVNGWSKPVHVTVNVQSATATKAAVIGQTDLTIESTPKMPSNLPAQANVTWSNGDVTKENITWETVSKDVYAPRDGGKFTLHGTVTGTDKTVSLMITVKPAIRIVTFPNNGQVTRYVGDDMTIEFPKTIEVKWSNGDKTVENVVWTGWLDNFMPKVDSKNRFAEYGTFFRTGHLVNDKDYSALFRILILPASWKSKPVVPAMPANPANPVKPVNPVKNVVKTPKADLKKLANTGAEVSVIVVMTIGFLALAGVTGAVRLTRKDA